MKKLFTTTALVALMAGVSTAQAETVTTKTVVTPKPVTERVVYLKDFDRNNDKVVTLAEVGDKLFYEFDQDGNEIIDNIEWDNNKSVITITPTEVETITLVDHDDDGDAEHVTYKYDVFMQKSHLTKFDKNENGLSPKEFVDEYFMAVDENKNKFIELDEWRATYMASIETTLEEGEKFNSK